MTYETFRFHIKRLKDKFGPAHFQPRKEYAIWQEVKTLADSSILHVLRVLGNRPPNNPPTIEDFSRMAAWERTQNKPKDFKEIKDRALENLGVSSLMDAILKRKSGGEE